MPLSKFYSWRSYCFKLGYLTILCLFGFTSLQSQGLPSLTCHSKLNASLDINCEVIIDGTDILAGEDPGAMPGDYELTVKHKSDDTEGTVYSSDVSAAGPFEVSNTGTYIKFTAPGSFTVSVERLSDGVTCWGHLDIEDKLPPLAEACACPDTAAVVAEECIFKCASVGSFLDDTTFTGQLGLNPVFMDNCDSTVDVIFHDELVKDSICGNWYITRQWQALTNVHGKEKLVDLNCTQRFLFEAIGMDSIFPPKTTVRVPCGVDTHPDSLFDYLSNTLPDPDSAIICVYPYIVDTIPGVDTIYAPLGVGFGNTGASSYCKIATSYADTWPTVVCGESVKFVRTWTIIDWCNDNAIYRYPQIIKVEDDEAPTFTIPDTLEILITNPWVCGEDVMIPPPDSLMDNCDDIDEIDYLAYINGPNGFMMADESNDYKFDHLPPGTYNAVYKVFDRCDNDSTANVVIIVKDAASPVVITKDQIIVTFSSFDDECVAKVFAHNINAGTYDACDGTDLLYEVKRKGDHDSLYGEFVKFSKEDISGVTENGIPYGSVNVAFRATDECDNSSFGWTTVRLEDKSSKIEVECGDLEIPLDCEDGDLTSAIEANAPVVSITACETSELETEYEILESKFNNGCKVGTVTVAYYVKGSSEVICTKEFDFGDSNNLVIDWPDAEIIVSCTDDDFGDVVVSNDDCHLIATSVVEESFDFPSHTGFCKKIIRKFTVIDWCTFDANDADDSTGIYKFIQIVKVDDDTRPIISCEDEVFELNNDCETSGIQIKASASDEAGCETDDLLWEAAVDSDDNGSFDLQLEVQIGINNQVSADVPGSFGPGTYDIRWTATDDCGNFDAKFCSFTVVDNSVPVPQCITTISTAVMNTSGTAVIWASDFDPERKSGKLCGGEIYYSFSDQTPFEPSFTITCDDLDSTTQLFDLQVYVWDEFGNYDFCHVQLRVDDNVGACQAHGNAAIGGYFATESGEMIEDVEVTLNDGQGIDQNYMTELDGHYAFDNNPMYSNYDIQAAKLDDHINGVSTLDLILIQRHILNMKQLDSPYKVIAADANSDESVTAIDLVVLRRLVLGLIDELPGGKAWKFIDAHQTFDNILDPWPLDEAISIKDVQQDMMDQDFIGVKIGDVNGNAIANSAHLAKSRSNSPMVLTTPNRQVNAGDRLEVSFNADGWSDVYGLQLSLNTDKIRVMDVTSQSIPMTAENIHISDDNVVLSWNELTPSQGAEVLTLEVEVLEDGWLSDFIDLSQSFESEAYKGDEITIHPIQLTFRDAGSLDGMIFDLYQNEPNPFSDETIIKFRIPQDGQVDLTIFDVTGQQVYRLSDSFSAGLKHIRVDKDLLKSSGVWYYQLSYAGHVATRKMIAIE